MSVLHSQCEEYITDQLCVRAPSTPERDREDERARQHAAALQMTSPTHCRERAAAATASRSRNQPPPPPQPFPHPPCVAQQPSNDPFVQPHVQAPNPSPRDAVAAIRAQLAAGPQLNPVHRRSNQSAPPTNLALGGAAIVPPQPFPHHPPPHVAQQPSNDPFVQPHVRAPNPSPRDAVAAIRAQLEAGPQLISTRQRSNQPAANLALGRAAIADLHAQAQRIPTRQGNNQPAPENIPRAHPQACCMILYDLFLICFSFV